MFALIVLCLAATAHQYEYQKKAAYVAMKNRDTLECGVDLVLQELPEACLIFKRTGNPIVKLYNREF